MKFIAIEKELPDVKTNTFTDELKISEASRILELFQSGELREIYFRQDRPEAVLIFECNTVSECKALLSSLPMVKNKLIDFDLIPLIPYPGFLRLLPTIDNK
ncbi:MAG: hypothetical protein JW908_13995 [Anaerolineales bacterium]|nr:hypothetical protein [Anaerolineales bacterium]